MMNIFNNNFSFEKLLFVLIRYFRAIVVAIVNVILIKKIGTEEYSRLIDVFLILSFTIYLSFGLREEYFKDSNKITDLEFQKDQFTRTFFKLFILSLLGLPLCYLFLNEFHLLVSLIAIINILRSFYNADIRLIKKIRYINYNNIVFSISLLLFTIILVNSVEKFVFYYLLSSIISFCHYSLVSTSRFNIKLIVIKKIFKSKFITKTTFYLLLINLTITAFASIDRIYIKTYSEIIQGSFQFTNSISEGVSIGLESLLMIFAPIIFHKKSKLKYLEINQKDFLKITTLILFLSIVVSILIGFFIKVLMINSVSTHYFLVINIFNKVLLIYLTAQAYNFSSINMEFAILRRLLLSLILISSCYFMPRLVFDNDPFNLNVFYMGSFVIWGICFLNIREYKKIC